MGNTTRQFSDGFHLLHLAQLRLGALTLGDLRQEFVVSTLKLRCSLRDASFENVVGLLQPDLAFAQIFEQ